MSPYQHGEVFVTDDGAETDLDLGHYERFIDENLTGASSVSSGKIYWNVLNRERAGTTWGVTVQIIPHITGEIKDHIYALEARTPTWPLWRSAAPWATLRASPSWSPSARWPPSGAVRTSCLFTCPSSCPSRAAGSSRASPPSTR